MIFLGKRTEDGCKVYKIDNLMHIEELNPVASRLIHEHDPNFEWGYEGCGPKQLAIALLLETIGSVDAVILTYNDFEREIIAKLPDQCWAIDTTEIRYWFEKQPTTQVPF